MENIPPLSNNRLISVSEINMKFSSIYKLLIFNIELEGISHTGKALLSLLITFEE